VTYIFVMGIQLNHFLKRPSNRGTFTTTHCLCPFVQTHYLENLISKRK